MTLVVDDDGLTLPAVRAGRQLVALRNDGQHPHQFEFGQLHEGASFEDAATFLQDGQRGELPAEWAGGTPGVAPGETVLAGINLDAGQWSVVDVVDDLRTATAAPSGDRARQPFKSSSATMLSAPFGVAKIS